MYVHWIYSLRISIDVCSEDAGRKRQSDIRSSIGCSDVGTDTYVSRVTFDKEKKKRERVGPYAPFGRDHSSHSANSLEIPFFAVDQQGMPPVRTATLMASRISLLDAP